ncbi:MAG: ATP-binding protein [Bacilli bacterium]
MKNKERPYSIFFHAFDMLLQDEALATAILDRLVYRCQVFNLKGNSYRLENRETIFK